MLSPVWTPTGSIFSILQIVTAFPFLSRITSNSISFHPAMHFSISICPTRLSLSPWEAISESCPIFSAMPPPVPPRVYAGRTITGYPVSSAKLRASSRVVTTLLAIQGSPMASIASLKACLSSAVFIACVAVPRSLTHISSRKPDSASSIARLRPVCPPSVGSKLSGLSLTMIFLSVSTSRGSIYTLSAMLVSVIIVAGLLFTSTTSRPSSFSSRQA